MKSINYSLFLAMSIAVFIPVDVIGNALPKKVMSVMVFQNPSTSCHLTNFEININKENGIAEKTYYNDHNNTCTTVQDCSCDELSKYDNDPMEPRCNGKYCECVTSKKSSEMPNCFPNKNIADRRRKPRCFSTNGVMAMGGPNMDIMCIPKFTIIPSPRTGVSFIDHMPNGQCQDASDCDVSYKNVCNSVAEDFHVNKEDLESVCMSHEYYGTCACVLRNGKTCPVLRSEYYKTHHEW